MSTQNFVYGIAALGDWFTSWWPAVAIVVCLGALVFAGEHGLRDPDYPATYKQGDVVYSKIGKQPGIVTRIGAGNCEDGRCWKYHVRWRHALYTASVYEFELKEAEDEQ